MVARTRRATFDEAGGASVEYSGVVGAAAVLIVAVLLAVGTASPVPGDIVRWAWCKVSSLGEGDCGLPATSAQRVPPQPCVVESRSRSLRTEVEVLVFKAADGRRFEVARLSDGRYRVTQLFDSSGGLETGVGAGVTMTVNDRTVGGSALAEVSGMLDVSRGRVWYTSDPREVERMVSEDDEDAVESAVLGGGPGRWLWERGQDVVGWATGNGDYELPDPDEEFESGGASIDASAEMTLGALRGGAFAGGTRVLGRRVTRDGSTTVYFRSSMRAGAGVQYPDEQWRFDGAQATGTVEVVTAATYSPDGELREVSVTGIAVGETKGAVSALFGGSGEASLENTRSGAVVYQAILPVRDGADRQVANDFLVAAGVSQLGPVALTPVAAPQLLSSAPRFFQATRDRGSITRQTFDTDDATVFAVNAEGKLGLELGAGVSVDRARRTSTGAEYWDGTGWVARTDCG